MMIRIIPSSIRSSIRGVVGSSRSTTLAINSTLSSNSNITSLSSINQPPTYLNTTHHHNHNNQQIRSLHLTPREIDHLQLHSAGRLAQHRLARGLKLNIPESKALIAMQMMELVRNGKCSTVTTASTPAVFDEDGYEGSSEGNTGKIVQREGSVSNLMSIGTQLLGRNQVLPGVANLIKDVQVEATFPDGTKVRF